MPEFLPKIRSNVQGRLDNTKSTVKRVMDRVKTGKPSLFDRSHFQRFAELNRQLIGK